MTLKTIFEMILGIIIGVDIVGLILFLYEIKPAPIIDDKEPFVWKER